MSPCEASILFAHVIALGRIPMFPICAHNYTEVKQNTRNVLAQRPELLPYFFAMTVHDALTFNPGTLDGGPNGSLQFELDRDVNSSLRDAHEAIVSIRALQRQDMSYADTCAFAGAVAVEVTGGPRIIVQLGREDAKEADPVNRMELYKAGAPADDLRAAFDAAGLDGIRDVVLVHGAIGSLNDIGQIRATKLQEQAIASGEDDADGDESVGDFDDVTYGKVQRKKRGAVLVESNVSLLTIGGQKFGNGYLKALLKVKDASAISQRDRAILENAQMRAVVQQYADNNSKFLTDVADLFQKLSLLGSEFESMKLEA